MDVQKYRGYLRGLLVIAVPLILSQLINQTQMIIDRIFLGHADSSYMSVLGNATTPLWATVSFCYSLATGASILISQGVGARDRGRVEQYGGALVKYNSIVPVLLFFFWLFAAPLVFRLMGVAPSLMQPCLDYVRWYAPVFLLMGLGSALSVILQTSNYTKPLALYGLIRSVLNIVLDWLLIFGNCGFPAMGIKGAALGTTIADYGGSLYLLFVYLRSTRLTTRPAAKSVRGAPLWAYVKSARLGVNTALEDFAWNLGNIILISILNSIDEFAAGIYSIVFGIEILAVVIIGAFGSGTLTLSSEATGRHDVRQYRGVCLCAYGLSVAVTLAMIVLALLFPRQLVGLFTNDAPTIASAGVYLLMISVNLFAKSANIIIGCGIRGSGDTRWMFCTQLFGVAFIVSVALLFVRVGGLGIAGVFLAVLLDEAVRALVNLWRIVRIARSMGSR